MPVTTNTITGTAQGVSDTLFGTHANDRISGLSGDDVIYAGRGDDVVIGGQGNDVMVGGLGADEFQFSAGHIGDGEVDYITDFSLRFGDTLNFLDSANGTFEVLSIERDFLDETTANGVDLKNNVNFGTDVTFTVRNSENGNTQEIVLLDSYAFSLRDMWDEFLDDMGLVWGDNTPAETEVPEEIVEVEIAPTDDIFIVG